MSIEALPYVTLLGFFFGSTLIVSRFSIGQFEPTTYIGIRLVIASLCHVAIYIFSANRVFPKDRTLWKHAIVMGVIGTAIPVTTIVSSLQFQSSGVTSLLLTLSPAVTVVLAHFALDDEKLTLRKSGGVLLALAGAILLAIQGEDGLPDVAQADLTGYVLVLIAVLCASAMAIYARKYLRFYDAIDVASIRMWAATIVVMPLSLWFVGFDLSRVTTEGYLALVYAALIGTFAALFLTFYNIKRFGATTAAIVSYFVPIVAGVGGVIFLNEEITPTLIVGMVAIIAGVAFIQERTSRELLRYEIEIQESG